MLEQLNELLLDTSKSPEANIIPVLTESERHLLFSDLKASQQDGAKEMANVSILNGYGNPSI